MAWDVERVSSRLLWFFRNLELGQTEPHSTRRAGHVFYRSFDSFVIFCKNKGF